MSLYSKRALADNTQQYLLSSLGELLMVLDNSALDMAALTSMLSSESYEARFRLFVLHNDETIDYEIPQEDIILNAGSYSENYQQGQRRNLNIFLSNIDGRYTPSINGLWVHTRFRFDIGIEYEGETYWFTRGIYILGNPTATRTDSDKQISLAFIDKFGLFEGKSGTLEATYEIPAGTLVSSALSDILTLDNGSGYPLDLKPIIYDNVFKNVALPYTIRKDAGSTLGEIILEIGNVLNAEMFYNNTGNFCVININDTINDINKPSLWNYSDEEAEIFDDSASFDFEGVVNEIHVVGDNINQDLIWAVAKNDNPESPLCIQRIGRRIDYINDSNIYNEGLAQDRANYELRRFGILKTTLTIRVSFNPLILVNNLITIEDGFFGYKREKFLIQSISYNIGTDNAMTLVCSNISNFKTLTKGAIG